MSDLLSAVLSIRVDTLFCLLVLAAACGVVVLAWLWPDEEQERTDFESRRLARFVEDHRIDA